MVAPVLMLRHHCNKPWTRRILSAACPLIVESLVDPQLDIGRAQLVVQRAQALLSFQEGGEVLYTLFAPHCAYIGRSSATRKAVGPPQRISEHVSAIVGTGGFDREATRYKELRDFVLGIL